MILKHLSSLLTAAAMLLTSTAIPVSAEETVSEGQATFPTAQEIVDDIVIGWNLGNTLESYRDVRTDDPHVYEQGYGSPTTTQKMIQDIHEVFTMNGSCENAKLAFDLGHQIGKYYVYDISLTEVS